MPVRVTHATGDHGRCDRDVQVALMYQWTWTLLKMPSWTSLSTRGYHLLHLFECRAIDDVHVVQGRGCGMSRERQEVGVRISSEPRMHLKSASVQKSYQGKDDAKTITATYPKCLI